MGSREGSVEGERRPHIVDSDGVGAELAHCQHFAIVAELGGHDRIGQGVGPDHFGRRCAENCYSLGA